jgi:hypothetical protein
MYLEKLKCLIIWNGRSNFGLGLGLALANEAFDNGDPMGQTKNNMLFAVVCDSQLNRRWTKELLTLKC